MNESLYACTLTECMYCIYTGNKEGGRIGPSVRITLRNVCPRQDFGYNIKTGRGER